MKNRDKIEWKLISDLAVQSRNDAIEKVNWYAMRWKIETFHKIVAPYRERFGSVTHCGHCYCSHGYP